MIYAPVLVIVYNRYNHFFQCIESLKKCIGAEHTDLFVAIDAPSRDEDIEAVSRVYEYAITISGFKNVTIYKREENLGSRQNLSQAREAIMDEYDRIITSEDDNIFAKDFLLFLNEGLEVFKDRKDIHAICGYGRPVKMPDTYTSDTYIWTGFSAWGSATWKDRFNMINREPPLDEIRQYLSVKRNIKKLDSIAGNYKPALWSIVESGKYTGDTIICYHLVKDSRYCVFPVISRVRNIGHDGSGEHCGVNRTNKYHGQIISDGSKQIKLEYDIQPDNEVYKVLASYFRRSKLYPIKRMIKKIIFYDKWKNKNMLSYRGRK